MAAQRPRPGPSLPPKSTRTGSRISKSRNDESQTSSPTASWHSKLSSHLSSSSSGLQDMVNEFHLQESASAPASNSSNSKGKQRAQQSVDYGEDTNMEVGDDDRAKDDAPFRIMDLPTEIRLEIYRACLTRPYNVLLSKQEKQQQQQQQQQQLPKIPKLPKLPKQSKQRKQRKQRRQRQRQPPPPQPTRAPDEFPGMASSLEGRDRESTDPDSQPSVTNAPDSRTGDQESSSAPEEFTSPAQQVTDISAPIAPSDDTTEGQSSSASIVTPSQGQSSSASIVTPSQGQSSSASIVTPSQGQSSSASSVTLRQANRARLNNAVQQCEIMLRMIAAISTANPQANPQAEPSRPERRQSQDPLLTNVLLVSKETYKEARGILYSENFFTLDIATAIPTLARLHQQSRRRIQRIEIEIPTYNEILDNFQETVRLSLRYCTGLKKLVINMPFTLPVADHGSSLDNPSIYANGFDILRWLPQQCEVVLRGNVGDEIKMVVSKHLHLAKTLDKTSYARRQIIPSDAFSAKLEHNAVAGRLSTDLQS